MKSGQSAVAGEKTKMVAPEFRADYIEWEK
jgi:hypothetical protein